MKLRTKISAGFAIICIIFALLSSIIFVLLQEVQTDAQEVTETILPTSMTSSNVLAGIILLAFYGADYYYSGDQASIDGAIEQNKTIEAQLKTIEDNLNTPAIQSNPELITAIASLAKNYRAYNQAVAEIATVHVAMDGANKQLRINYDSMAQLCESFLKIQETRQRQAYSAGDIGLIDNMYNGMAAVRFIRTALDTNFIALLQGQRFRLASYFENADKISTSMMEKAKWLKETAGIQQEKQLAQEMIVLINNTVETTNTLSKAIVTSLDNANNLGAFREAATKDSTEVSVSANRQSLERLTGAMDKLNTSLLSLMIGLALAIIMSTILTTLIIHSITKPVNFLVEVLGDGANEVEKASSQLTLASKSLASGAAENAASLEETSATLEELSSMSRRNANNSVEANSLMLQAAEAVQKADDSMISVIKAMEEISTSGNEISKIIKTIDGIAFQTNLLALNAAVEAARAGEAGAGFAVVADEVRNLAIRSADAAKSTSQLIAGTISNINSGATMVNATAENFKVMAEHSGKIAALLSEISEASKEQSQGISQITTAITEIDKITQSNAVTADDSAMAASQLFLQAKTLLEAVSDLNVLVHGPGQSLAQGGRRGQGRQSAIEVTATGAKPSPQQDKKLLPRPTTKARGVALYQDQNQDNEFNF